MVQAELKSLRETLAQEQEHVQNYKVYILAYCVLLSSHVMPSLQQIAESNEEALNAQMITHKRLHEEAQETITRYV